VEKIGSRMKRLRESQGLRLKEVAAKAKVAPSTYREWEYGREIKGEPYVKIAEALNIGLYELLTGEKGKSSKLVDEISKIEGSCQILRKHLESLQ